MCEKYHNFNVQEKSRFDNQSRMELDRARTLIFHYRDPICHVCSVILPHRPGAVRRYMLLKYR